MFSVPNTGRNPHQSFAASLFAGELGFGSVKRDWKKARRSRWKVVPGVKPPLRSNKNRTSEVKKNENCVFHGFFVVGCVLKWRDGVLWTLKMLAKCYNGSMKHQLDDYDLVGSWWHTLIHAVISYIRIEKIQSKNWRSDGHAPGKKFRQYYHPLVN